MKLNKVGICVIYMGSNEDLLKDMVESLCDFRWSEVDIFASNKINSDYGADKVIKVNSIDNVYEDIEGNLNKDTEYVIVLHHTDILNTEGLLTFVKECNEYLEEEVCDVADIIYTRDMGSDFPNRNRIIRVGSLLKEHPTERISTLDAFVCNGVTAFEFTKEEWDDLRQQYNDIINTISNNNVINAFNTISENFMMALTEHINIPEYLLEDDSDNDDTKDYSKDEVTAEDNEVQTTDEEDIFEPIKTNPAIPLDSSVDNSPVLDQIVSDNPEVMKSNVNESTFEGWLNNHPFPLETVDLTSDYHNIDLDSYIPPQFQRQVAKPVREILKQRIFEQASLWAADLENQPVNPNEVITETFGQGRRR